MTINYEISKVNPFPKMKILDISDCKIISRNVIDRTVKYFPNLEELCFVGLQVEAQLINTNKISFPKIERLCIDNTLMDPIINASKDKKEKIDQITERIFKAFFEDNKSLRYFETFIKNKPDNFTSYGDEISFIEGWTVLGNLTNLKHIEEIRIVCYQGKSTVFGLPKVSKVGLSRKGTNII